MDPFAMLVSALERRGVRFVLIGVAGANYYAIPRQTLFATQDRDLLLPLDGANLLAAWQVCLASGLDLWSAGEPLDLPVDLPSAQRVVEHRATIRADDSQGLQVDLNLLMAGFDFEQVWLGHHTFSIGGVSLPVARLEHIVASKRAAGRDKDLLFLEQHRGILEDILRSQQDD